MKARNRPNAEFRLDQVLSAAAVARGGVVRRSVSWVEREVGRDRLIGEVRARGCHLLEVGGQFLIVCSTGPIRKIV